MPPECQTVWIQIRPNDIIGPDLGPNCLLRLSTDDTGRQKIKGVVPSQEHVHTESTQVCTLHIVKKKEIRVGIEIIKMIIPGSFAPFLHKIISFMILLAHLSRRLIGELIVYPWSGVRRRRPQCSNIFFSETAWLVKAKFYVEPPWVGGTKFCSRHLGHVTKMAATPIYGKNPSKIFFSRTGRPIFTKLGM